MKLSPDEVKRLCARFGCTQRAAVPANMVEQLARHKNDKKPKPPQPDKPTKRRMKISPYAKIAAVAMLAVAIKAADVNFAWNPSPSQGVTNYALYISTTQITATNFKTAPFRVNAGTNLTATFADAQPGTYWVTATAQGDKLESPPCGILVFEMPAPPPNLRTVVYQYSTTLTNWQDVGFFKLKIP